MILLSFKFVSIFLKAYNMTQMMIVLDINPLDLDLTSYRRILRFLLA